MKKLLQPVLIILGTSVLLGQTKISFDDYFVDRAMRVDLYLIGDAKEETMTMDEIYQEGIWPGNPASLLNSSNNGRYWIKLFDLASNNMIYSCGFDCMFGEYKTTTPALNGLKRVFQKSIRVPFPKRPVLLLIQKRDRENLLHALFTQRIDPSDYHIIKESYDGRDFVYTALKSGDPHKCVDLAFLGEGYTAEDREKFKSDVDRFTGYLFDLEPYKSLKARFNVYGVLRPSPERATDEPRQGVFNKTVFNSSFNAFDLDRYLLIEENRLMHSIAAQVPYDAIVVMVNSSRYGGGGIYNDYCAATVDNAVSKRTFVHEFGHSFAGLADEYYSSDVAYNDFYPKGVEPLEPNITALLDPSRVKWQDILSPGVAVPTEYGREEVDSLQNEKRNSLQEMKKEIERARQDKASDRQLKMIEDKYKVSTKSLDQQIEGIRAQNANVMDKVGVFEGAGYSAKGLYRPMVNCLMISNPKDEFCKVCQRAIARMIDYYSGD
jgi:hypothetical protein